jgi:hypothetical protein
MSALNAALNAMPQGWAITIQRGDDWGNYTNRWYAIAENTVELPDGPTGRLGVGSTPDEALYDLAEQLAKISKVPSDSWTPA